MFNCLVLNYCHAAPLPIRSPLLSEKSLWSGGTSVVMYLILPLKSCSLCITNLCQILQTSSSRVECANTHMGDAAYFGADCFLRRIIPGLGEGTLKVIFPPTSYDSSLIIVHRKFANQEQCLISWIGQCSIFRRILKEFRIIFKTDKMLKNGAQISRYF